MRSCEMARLTDERRAARTAVRRRREALEAEAEHERREARRKEWQAAGAYLTRDELEAGEACRGCGVPVIDGLGDWSLPRQRTPEEQAAFAAADDGYRARHGDCRSHRWSISGSRSWHCGHCCPPHPLNQHQIDFITAMLRSPSNPKELNTWRLTLTCEHVVERKMHRSNRQWSTRSVECAVCARHRGVLEAERLHGADDIRHHDIE